MTVVVGTGGSVCGPSLGYGVNTTGGVPPYTIQASFQGIGQTFTNDADGDVSGDMPMDLGASPSSFSATVTDVNGCVASATETFTPRIVMQSNVGFAVDSVNEAALLQVYYSRYGPGKAVNVCPNQSGLFTTNVGGVNGTLASAWTFAPGSPGKWTYQTPLPPGPTQWIAGLSQMPIDCNGYQQCCCADQVNTINVPVVPHYNENGGVNIRPRVLLQGPLVSGLMKDSLRVKGLLPLQEPYSTLGYTYTGRSPGLTTTAGVLAVQGNNAVVDWVIVELRSPTTPFGVIASRPALVQRDGDVMDLDGDGYVHFGSVAPGNYRMAIRHRNHLGAMTSTQVALIASPVPVVDLTTGLAYGTGAVTLVGGKYCLWAGDASGNGVISYTGANNDRDPMLVAVGSTTPNNSVNNVYNRRDANLDGVIKYTGPANDRDVILLAVGSTTPNNTRTQQLP
jgi:hypothetical protein